MRRGAMQTRRGMLGLAGLAAGGLGLGLWNGPRASPFKLAGLGGQESGFARIVRAEQLRIGPKQYDRPLITLQGPGGMSGEDWDGIIGMPIRFAFCRITSTGSGPMKMNKSTIPPVAWYVTDSPLSWMMLVG